MSIGHFTQMEKRLPTQVELNEFTEHFHNYCKHRSWVIKYDVINDRQFTIRVFSDPALKPESETYRLTNTEIIAYDKTGTPGSTLLELDDPVVK